VRYGDRGPLTGGKTGLLGLATLVWSVLGVFPGGLIVVGMSITGTPLPLACVLGGSVLGAVAAMPLSWWFRSKRGLAIGAGVGATLGIAAMPFV
jgi:hypothetical protein